MKKRNKLDNLKPFKPMGEQSLAENPLCVKVNPETYKAIRAMPERSKWLRETIETAAIEQGLVPLKDDAPESDRA